MTLISNPFFFYFFPLMKHVTAWITQPLSFPIVATFILTSTLSFIKYHRKPSLIHSLNFVFWYNFLLDYFYQCKPVIRFPRFWISHEKIYMFLSFYELLILRKNLLCETFWIKDQIYNFTHCQRISCHIVSAFLHWEINISWSLLTIWSD